MTLVALMLTAALAAEPECSEAFFPPDEGLSVAWLSPVGQRVRARTWIEVVATGALRDWLRADPSATLGRTLQLLGRRKKPEDPRRLYKVTVFEARVPDLCRPIKVGEGAPPLLEGVALCDGHTRRGSSCGYTVDRSDGSRGLDVYRIQWRDAAILGFCVLPAARFLEEGRLR